MLGRRAGATLRHHRHHNPQGSVILENAGTVIRTYGGVVLNKDEADPPIDHKTLINTHKKAQIAEAAVRYIHDGDSIILDAGSTVLQMVPLLSRFTTSR